jgi:hypothetical protein
VIALRDRVTVTADEGLSEMQARVRVHGPDGPQEAFHDLDRPLSYDQRRQRILAKAAALIGENRAIRLVEAVDAADLPAFLSIMVT